MKLLRKIRHWLYIALIFVPTILFGGCTTITETTVVYPVVLRLPGGDLSLSVGLQYGIGVSATILGKEYFDAEDTITFTVRDPSVLRLVSESTGRSVFTDAQGIPGINIFRFLDFKGLREGSSYVIFRVASQIDSVRFVVHPGKG